MAELVGEAGGAGAVSAPGAWDSLVDEVYRRHNDRLIGFFVRRTGDRALAEDLAQDTFVRLAAAVHRLDPGRSVWPYLRTIANNVVMDHHRRGFRQAESDVNEELADESVPGPDLDEVVVLRSLLEGAIGDLSERQQVAVELRCARGWNVAESAEFLGIGPGAFRQLLFRARRHLRAALDESGARVRGLALPLLLDLRMRTRMTADRVREFAQPTTSLGVEALAGVAVAATIGVTAVVGISGAEADPHPPSSASQVLDLGRQGVAPASPSPVAQQDQEVAVGARHTAAAPEVVPDAPVKDTPPTSAGKATVIETPDAVPDSGGNVTVEDDEEYFVVSSEVAARTGVEELEEVGAHGDAVSITCGSTVGQLACDGES